jgi:hypothetical protein
LIAVNCLQYVERSDDAARAFSSVYDRVHCENFVSSLLFAGAFGAQNKL